MQAILVVAQAVPSFCATRAVPPSWHIARRGALPVARGDGLSVEVCKGGPTPPELSIQQLKSAQRQNCRTLEHRRVNTEAHRKGSGTGRALRGSKNSDQKATRESEVWQKVQRIVGGQLECEERQREQGGQMSNPGGS